MPRGREGRDGEAAIRSRVEAGIGRKEEDACTETGRGGGRVLERSGEEDEEEE